MSEFGPHPRWPFRMAPEVRRTIADEVDVTLAGFPSRRPLESAITAYAEQLDDFLPADIRTGFQVARRQASEYAPSPSQVRICIAAALRARLERERPVLVPEPEPETFASVPAEIRGLWRQVLGEAPMPATRTPVEYVDGKPVTPVATPIADVVRELSPALGDARP